MGDLFDYLKWRGDIPFSQVPPTPVDAAIFSELVYIHFDGIVSDNLDHPVLLEDAAPVFLAKPEAQRVCRLRLDEKLLDMAARTRRFSKAGLVFYRDLYLPDEETQFAAMTFLLDDGSAFLAFRGTDYSLTGWKEDFNMSFQDAIPSQREALCYTQVFAESRNVVMRLGGHSKGGNIAVYAAAKCPPEIQERIVTVYNNDGPGFTDALMGNPGYLTIVPRIQTYIPQSSIVGMLFDHEEPYTVVKSSLTSILQHEIYSWEIQGGGFVHLEEPSQESRLIDNTINRWMAEMTKKEREYFVEQIFELLAAGGADQLIDLLTPKSIASVLMRLQNNEPLRNLLTDQLRDLKKAAEQAKQQIQKEDASKKSNKTIPSQE